MKKYVRDLIGINYQRKGLGENITKRYVEQGIWKEADTIEELVDCFVVVNSITGKGQIENMPLSQLKDFVKYQCKTDVYGAIWTSDGLKYVSKIDTDGELKLWRSGNYIKDCVEELEKLPDVDIEIVK